MSKLDDMIEQWCRWCYQGGIQGYSSVLQVIMSGAVFSGGGGGKAPRIDCFESCIESALVELSVDDLKAVEVFRVEHGVKRAGSLPFDATQHQKALKLGVSVRTYRYKLKKALKAVEVRLISEKYL